MYKIIERNTLPNSDSVLLEDWSEENTPEFPNLHGLCIAAYPLVARSYGFSIARPGERFRLQISFILSARKIYSRGCTSKKIGAIIKEKGGGG